MSVLQVPEGAKAPCRLMVQVPSNAQPQNILQVRIPDDAVGGQRLEAIAPNGVKLHCTVPPGARPGSFIFVHVPEAPASPSNSSPAALTREVMVRIPHGVKPGDQVQATAPDGTRFAFTVPANAVADSTIKVALDRVKDYAATRPHASGHRMDTAQTASASPTITSPAIASQMMEPETSYSTCLPSSLNDHDHRDAVHNDE